MALRSSIFYRLSNVFCSPQAVAAAMIEVQVLLRKFVKWSIDLFMIARIYNCKSVFCSVQGIWGHPFMTSMRKSCFYLPPVLMCPHEPDTSPSCGRSHDIHVK